MFQSSSAFKQVSCGLNPALEIGCSPSTRSFVDLSMLPSHCTQNLDTASFCSNKPCKKWKKKKEAKIRDDFVMMDEKTKKQLPTARKDVVAKTSQVVQNLAQKRAVMPKKTAPAQSKLHHAKSSAGSKTTKQVKMESIAIEVLCSLPTPTSMENKKRSSTKNGVTPRESKKARLSDDQPGNSPLLKNLYPAEKKKLEESFAAKNIKISIHEEISVVGPHSILAPSI